jgi:hypothetical protein
MDKTIFGVPETLTDARTVAHAAAQLLYRAAVANVAPMPAHEHTSLGWDADASVFQTHPLGGSGVMAELRLNPLVIRLGIHEQALQGQKMTGALAWLDEQLSEHGLEPASAVNVTYDLPDEVRKLDELEEVDGLGVLAAWFDLAAVSLEAFAQVNADIDPGPGPVRCWPHHFDIATYVSLEAGDTEEARGIGVGMSPGDSSYDQPYFYVNPWPHLALNALPEAVTPGRWHTDGYVGMIATGTAILSLNDVPLGTRTFLQASFETGRSALGV